MIKDKKELVQLVEGVKENKRESLEALHQHFYKFIKKYAYKYKVDFQTLEAEFDLILLYIINKNINDPQSILKYITVSFNNFNNFNIDKAFRLNNELSIVSLDEHSNLILNITELDFEDDDYPNLSKILKPNMIEILEEKYIDKLTCERIGELNNLSKQRISQKIISAKDKIINNYKIF